MPVTVAAFLALSLFSGCGIIVMIGEPVKKQDLSSVDEGEENLKAIRAMLADQATRRAEEKLSNPPMQPLPADPATSLVEPSSAPPSTASSSLPGRADLPAKLPWTPPASDRPTVQDRQVPAYTIPAPVGPDSSGSIRCAPDGLGGQRCLGR